MPQMNFYDAQLVKDPDGKYAVELENAHVVLSEDKQQRLAQKGVEPQAITLGVRRSTSPWRATRTRWSRAPWTSAR